jgi:hypothetical protein
VRTYDGGNGDYGFGVAVDGTGNIWVVGRTSKPNPASSDILLRKYDAAGMELWSKPYDSGGADEGYGIANDTSGNAVLVGVVGADLWIRKVDAGGQELWTRTVARGIGAAVAIDKNDNVVVAGSAIGLLKYDGSGNELWSQVTEAGVVPAGSAQGVAVDAQGNIAAVSTAPFIDPDAGRTNLITVRRYDPAGKELWSRGYGAGRDGLGYGVSVDRSGNVLATGKAYLETPTGWKFHLWTRKYSSDGNELWTRIEDVLVTDHAGVATDGSDDVIAVTNERAYKYDPLGMPLWTIALPGTANAVAADRSGQVFITGSVSIPTDSNGFVDPADLWVAKFAP